MKNVILAAIGVTLSTTASFAEGIGFGGNVNYQVEAQTFETNVGATYTMGQMTFSPLMTASYSSANDLEFEGMDFTAAYALNPSMRLYATVEADGDLTYDETTVGLAFNF
jgi:hypothetical protein|tara:strand:+ start:139 stop:468 length:330 start_codon:yes stop_codon:yes gene_type:complete